MNSVTPVTNNVLKDLAAQASPENREQLRKKVRELVGQTFFGTLMQQMRSQMDPDNPFNGGRMGQAFGAQLDQTLISKWAGTAKFAVADKIAQQWIGVKEKA
jgi:hypothetical protein